MLALAGHNYVLKLYYQSGRPDLNRRPLDPSRLPGIARRGPRGFTEHLNCLNSSSVSPSSPKAGVGSWNGVCTATRAVEQRLSMQQRPKPQTELVTAALARGALDADSQGGGIGTGHLLAFLSLCPAVVSQPGEWSVRMPVRCRVGGVMGLGCAPGRSSCRAFMRWPWPHMAGSLRLSASDAVGPHLRLRPAGSARAVTTRFSEGG